MRLALATAILIGGVAGAAPPGAHVWHIVVPDDLDSAWLADRITGELAAAEEAKPRLVLLELAGDSGRWDLVARVGKTIRAMTGPVSVLLDDSRDRRVGVAQLVIGLSSRGCAISPGTRVRTGRDREMRAQAPADVAWGEVEADLARFIETPLALAPEGLADALLFPTASAWVLPGGPGSWTLTRERPGADSARLATQIVWLEDGDRWSFRAAPELLKSLALPIEAADSARDLLRRLGVRGLSTRRVELESGLRAAGVDVTRVLRDADLLIEDLRARLELPTDQSIAPDTIRKRGRGVVADARGALDALAGVEETLARYPELLRGPAPGQTAVAGTASTYATAWRRAVQTRHDRFVKLQAEGQALADR